MEVKGQTERDRPAWRALRYAHEGQHGHGTAAADPHGEEDDQQGGGEHHLAGVGRRVADRKSKGHGATQACRRRR